MIFYTVSDFFLRAELSANAEELKSELQQKPDNGQDPVSLVSVTNNNMNKAALSITEAEQGLAISLSGDWLLGGELPGPDPVLTGCENHRN